MIKGYTLPIMEGNEEALYCSHQGREVMKDHILPITEENEEVLYSCHQGAGT